MVVEKKGISVLCAQRFSQDCVAKRESCNQNVSKKYPKRVQNVSKTYLFVDFSLHHRDAKSSFSEPKLVHLSASGVHKSVLRRFAAPKLTPVRLGLTSWVYLWLLLWSFVISWATRAHAHGEKKRRGVETKKRKKTPLSLWWCKCVKKKKKKIHHQ